MTTDPTKNPASGAAVEEQAEDSSGLELVTDLAIQLRATSPEEQTLLASILKLAQPLREARGSADLLSLVHSSLRSEAEIDRLGMDHFEAVMSAKAPPMFKHFPDAESIPLPKEFPRVDTPFDRLLEDRFSGHNFAAEPLALETLSNWLHYSYGVSRVKRAYNQREFPFRRAPSAGGLQPVDLYVVVNAVESLKRGLYYYQGLDHALTVVDYGNMRTALSGCSIFQDWLNHAPVVAALVCNMTRVHWKYGDRSYRFVHVDSGVLTQNLYLVGTALGLNTCAVAAYFDDGLNDLLHLDGRDEFATLLFAIGNKPAMDALPGQPA